MHYDFISNSEREFHVALLVALEAQFGTAAFDADPHFVSHCNVSGRERFVDRVSLGRGIDGSF